VIRVAFADPQGNMQKDLLAIIDTYWQPKQKLSRRAEQRG
jgi:hypothetical protein